MDGRQVVPFVAVKMPGIASVGDAVVANAMMADAVVDAAKDLWVLGINAKQDVISFLDVWFMPQFHIHYYARDWGRAPVPTACLAIPLAAHAAGESAQGSDVFGCLVFHPDPGMSLFCTEANFPKPWQFLWKLRRWNGNDGFGFVFRALGNYLRRGSRWALIFRCAQWIRCRK